MSLWHCTEHGLTGPTPCCRKAGRAEVVLPRSRKQIKIDTVTSGGTLDDAEATVKAEENADVTDVVAAVRQDTTGWYWICRRTAEGGHPELAGFWEYPGGKVEAGESHQAALQRELREEFNVEAIVGRRLDSIVGTVSGKRFRVTFYRVYFDEEPVLRIHDAAKWLPLAEVVKLPHLPSGVEFNRRRLCGRASLD